MRSWQWLGIAVCVVSAPTWATQAAMVVASVGTTRAAPATPDRVRQRLAQHEAEVTRLQQAVKQQESHGKQAGEQLRQQDAEILKLQKQLQAMPKTAPLPGR